MMNVSRYIARRRTIFVVLLVILLCVLALRWGKGLLEQYGERRIREYLNAYIPFNVVWDRWSLDLIPLRLRIAGLRVESKATGDFSLWVLAERVYVSFNPALLLRRVVAIRRITLKGLRGRALLAGTGDYAALMPMLKQGQQGRGGGWSVTVGGIDVEGQELAVDLPQKKGSVTLRHLSLSANKLDTKGPFPVRMAFEEGECTWKGQYRLLQSGGLVGSLTGEGITVDSLQVLFPEEGYLRWKGTVSKGHPGIVFDGAYNGVLLCDTLAIFLKPFRQMEGKVTSTGKIGGKWRQMKVEGDLSAPRFSWRDYHFSNVRGRFGYHLGIVSFEDMEGIWREGNLAVSSLIELKKHTATVDIHAAGLPSTSMMKNWSSLFPGTDLLWTGSMDWRITWPQRQVESEGTLRVEAPFAPAHALAGQKAEIETRFTSQRNLLALKDFSIAVGENRIQAEGEYDLRSKKVRISYTGEIRERNLASGIWGFPVKGRGTFSGHMDEHLNQPRFAGEFQGKGVTFRHLRADMVGLKYNYFNGRVHLDDMQGSLDGGRIAGTCAIDLSHARVRPEIHCTWSAHAVPLAEIAGAIPYRPGFPFQGMVSGEGTLDVRGSRVTSEGSFRGEETSLMGQPVGEVKGEFTTRPGVVSFRNVFARREEGVIEVDLSLGRDDVVAMRVHASSWHVMPLEWHEGRTIPLEGTLSLTVSGKGKDMEGNFEVKGLSYKGRGGMTVTGGFERRGDDVQASLTHSWGNVLCSLDLRGEIPFTFSSVWEGFPIADPNTGIFQDPQFSVTMSGKSEVRGAVREGISSLAGSFRGSELVIAGAPGRFEVVGGYEFVLRGREITIPGLSIKGERGSLDVQGTWLLPDRFDLKAAGIVPLTVFQDNVPATRGLSGKAELDVHARGSTSRPLFDGKILLSGGGFSVPEYNFRADSINGEIWFTKQSVYIKELVGYTRGGGGIVINGIVVYQGTEIDSFDVTARIEDLYLYKRDAYKGFLEGQLEWVGTSGVGILGGNILVMEARHTSYRDILQFLLARKREVETEGLLQRGLGRKWGKWVSRTTLNVGLDLGNDFRVRSPFYVASLTGGLSVRGTLNEPWLDGEIEVDEGEIIIGSQRFDITSARLALNDPAVAEPTINAVAVKDINSHRLRINVFGPVSKPNLQFSSTPYLSQPEILNMVFFGLTTEENGREQERDILSLMLSTTSSVLTNVIGEDIAYYTGLDMLRLNMFPQDLFRLDILNLRLQEEGGGVEQFTVGKTLSKRLKIKYSHLKGEEQREIAEAEYSITDHLTLIGAQDDQGTYSIDLNIGFSF
ncbi:MAG: translocation/assembly module TamB domain-containing protein [bacterium]